MAILADILSQYDIVAIQEQLPALELVEPGHPRADDRAILNGIWYVLWTGCQWKALHRDWFGVCSSSTIHARFQDWRAQGFFVDLLVEMVLLHTPNQSRCRAFH